MKSKLIPIILLVSLILGCTVPSGTPYSEDLVFNTSIFEMSKIDYIIPLGNLNPPGHTLPTRHMYFWLTETADLVAPARIHVTNIHYFINNEDYEIGFQVSNDVSGYFIHIETLSPRLEAVVTYDNCEGDLCFTDLDMWFEEGEFIGQAGINKMSFDLGIIDERVNNDFISPERYSDSLIHAACGLDYFSDEIKSQYYAKLRRDIEPLCGTIAQDVEGTLQGNWFYTRGAMAYSQSTYHQELGFVHHAENFTRGVISFGGTFAEPNTFGFEPVHEGLINREPSEVTPDGDIYCYHRGWDDERIIVEMVNTETIRIEYQEKNCTEPVAFEFPFTYFR